MSAVVQSHSPFQSGSVDDLSKSHTNEPSDDELVTSLNGVSAALARVAKLVK